MTHFGEGCSKPCQYTRADQKSSCWDDIKGRRVLLDEVGEASNCRAIWSPVKGRGDMTGSVTQKCKSGCSIVMPNFACQLGWSTVPRYVFKTILDISMGVFLDKCNF